MGYNEKQMVAKTALEAIYHALKPHQQETLAPQYNAVFEYIRDNRVDGGPEAPIAPTEEKGPAFGSLVGDPDLGGGGDAGAVQQQSPEVKDNEDI